MIEQFSNLESFPKFYWVIALIGSLLFVFIMISAFLGMDGAHEIEDFDADVDTDAGIEFQFITFKNLVGFFTIFGWSGIACIDAGLPNMATMAISVFCGLTMMTIMAAMFYYMKKLNDSGTLNYKNAIGAIGEVYLSVGASRSKMGKVHVRVQGALRELEALSDSLEELKSGTIIKVVDVTSNGILIVNQTQKSIEPIKSKNHELPTSTRDI